MKATTLVGLLALATPTSGWAQDRGAPIIPPDSVADWIWHDSAFVGMTSLADASVHVLLVYVDLSVPNAQWTTALDSVGGVVVGGIPFTPLTGVFYVWVPNSGSIEAIARAADTLEEHIVVRAVDRVTRTFPSSGAAQDTIPSR